MYHSSEKDDATREILRGHFADIPAICKRSEKHSCTQPRKANFKRQRLAQKHATRYVKLLPAR